MGGSMRQRMRCIIFSASLPRRRHRRMEVLDRYPRRLRRPHHRQLPLRHLCRHHPGTQEYQHPGMFRSPQHRCHRRKQQCRRFRLPGSRRLRRRVGGRCRYHRSMPEIRGCRSLARRCTRRSIRPSIQGLPRVQLETCTPTCSRQLSCSTLGSSICWQRRVQYRRLSSEPVSASLSTSTNGSSA